MRRPQKSLIERNYGTAPGKFQLVAFWAENKNTALKQTPNSDSSKIELMLTVHSLIIPGGSSSGHNSGRTTEGRKESHINVEWKRGPVYLLWLQMPPSAHLMFLKLFHVHMINIREKYSSGPVQQDPWNLPCSDGIMSEIALHHLYSPPKTEIEFEVQVMQQHSIVSFYYGHQLLEVFGVLLFSINTLLLFLSGIFPAGLHCNNTSNAQTEMVFNLWGQFHFSPLFTVFILTCYIN